MLISQPAGPLRGRPNYACTKGTTPAADGRLIRHKFINTRNCILLGGDFGNGTMSSSARKKLLAHSDCAKEYAFDTESVYTFDFYQSLLDVSTYSLDLGIVKLELRLTLFTLDNHLRLPGDDWNWVH